MKESEKSVPTILLYAFVGWAWCGAIMAVGPQFLSMAVTLVLHAILGPAGFALLSALYYGSHTRPKPVVLAMIFVSVVIVLDAGLVAPVFVRSYAMFQSIPGTWLPFVLIFLCSWSMGWIVRKKKKI